MEKMPARRVWRGVWFPLAFALANPSISADTKVSSALFDRGVIFYESGNVQLMGKIFTNVPASEMPTYVWGSGVKEDGMIEVRSSTGSLLSTIVDNDIFLTGGLFTGQTSFPGQIRFEKQAGGTIASFSTDGRMYVAGTVSGSSTCYAPVTELTKWNDNSAVRVDDNCYNYANNHATYTFAQPGRATGSTAGSMTVAAVRAVAIRDGLSYVGDAFPGNAYTCSGNRALVFLTVTAPAATNKDYHWYRLDKAQGKWTHKPGGTPATDKDASGNLISNPLTANRNYGSYNYTENGGFYCTCGGNANIR